MFNQAHLAAAALSGLVTLGLTAASASPFSMSGSTVSSTGERGSSSDRAKAQGALESIFDSVFSVRFSPQATAAAGAGADHDSRECEKEKETTTAARPEEKKDEKKEAVGPEPIYFGF